MVFFISVSLLNFVLFCSHGPTFTWLAYFPARFEMHVKLILSFWPICPVLALIGSHGSEIFPGEIMGFSKSDLFDSSPFSQEHQ